MKIPEVYQFGSPCLNRNLSSGKRKRQTELLSELEEERNLNKQLRVKIKEKEMENSELKNNSTDLNKRFEKFDFRLHNKINFLELSLYQHKENIEEKTKKISELSSEIEKLNDQIDLLKEENLQQSNKICKLQESYQKIEKAEV